MVFWSGRHAAASLHLLLICLCVGTTLSQDYCESIFKSPTDCTDDTDCDFQSILQWNDDDIMIEIRSKNARDESDNLSWMAIGFSEDQLMPSTDIVMGWVATDGTATISDRWADGNTQPTIDSDNGADDLTATEGTYTDGLTVIKATRPREPADVGTLDLSITTTDPLYVFHVVTGGAVTDAAAGTISAHPSAADNIEIEQLTFTPLAECVAAEVTTDMASNVTATELAPTAGAAILNYSLAFLLFSIVISNLI